jgi:hypothetical protein
MRRRLLAVVSGFAICLGTALVAVPAAQAFTYQVLDMCADDPDGQVCVVSASRNGVPITANDPPTTPGTTAEWFYVDNGWRDGVFSFNLNTKTVGATPGTDVDSKSVDASATWVITVNTGARYPRELNSKTRNTVFTRGGNPTTGYWFSIRFNPVPVAWRYFDPSFTCDATSCGNDSTVADFVSGIGKGFSDGFVSDLADSPSPGYVSARSGFVLASNAQYQAEPYYDSGTNSIVVQMANPHLRAPGSAATGFFEAFLPYAYLRTQLGVPDPDTLTGGTFTVWRDGASASVPFTLTRTATGIWIRVAGIGFSRPAFRLHPGPSKPRKVHASKISAHKARVRFKKPANSLGFKVNRYQARCHKAGKAWHSAKTKASPITVGHLPKGKVFCQVRAHNKLGWGVWSAVKRT